MAGKEKLSTSQAAEIAGRRRATIYQAIRDGRLAAEKVETPRGPAWLIDPDDLQRFLNGRPAWAKRYQGDWAKEGTDDDDDSGTGAGGTGGA